MALLQRSLLALALVAASPAFAAAAPELHVVAQTRDSIWNAVAIDDAGTVYVAGPRWTGSRGPSVARIGPDGAARPFPDAAWNTADTTAPVTTRFVNVNAIHRDDHGGLWVVDTGVTGFGGTVIPGAAKLVRIDLASGKVDRVYPLDATIAKTHSYVDDIRFHGTHAYLTDAGEPGLIVLDIVTGKARRVLDASPFTKASDRDVVLDGKVVRTPDGSALRVNADPLEVSPDGTWLYFASLEGPWSRVQTRYLDDASLTGAALSAHVEAWMDLPPVGGTVMGRDGSLYFTDLAANALRRVTPAKTIETVLTDPRLHWVDAPAFDARGRLFLPVPQIDRVAMFQGGKSAVQWPVRVYRIDGLEGRAP